MKKIKYADPETENFLCIWTVISIYIFIALVKKNA